MPLTQSSTSLEYIRVAVTATVNGAAIDPTADAVYFAFLAPSVAPTSSDWVAGSWEVANGVALARCLVGPGGAKSLSAGSYVIWVKITDNPEVPQRAVDTLVVAP